MTAPARTESPAWPVFSLVVPLFALWVGTPAAIVLACVYDLPLHVFVSFAVVAHIAGLGTTMGFHRLFTHRSFQTSRPFEWFLMISGCAAGQSSPFYWIATHRDHHRHSDSEGDPHSPHAGTGGWLRRFFHAHQGWMFGIAHFDPALVRDLKQRRDLAWIDRHWYAWYLLGLLIPTVAAYLIGGTAFDALMGFLWGGLLRQAVCTQTTHAVNSVCHVWGSRPYATGEQSRNNFLFAILALGEGWHNNHHAFPTSARHGFRWWQPDLTWNLLWMLERVGLVWGVKRPKLDRVANAPLAEAAPPDPAPVQPICVGK